MSIFLPDDLPADLQDRKKQLIADSSRPSKFDSETMALATELLIGQFSGDALQKVRHVLEAFQALSPEQREKVIESGEKREELNRMLEVCYSLQNMYDVNPPPNEYSRYKAIPWAFGTNSGLRYLKLFCKTIWTADNWDYGDSDRVSFINTIFKEPPLTNAEIDAQQNYFDWLVRVTSSGYLASVCMSIKAQFLTYIMPKVTEISRVIRESFIDGTTWESALFALQGKKNETVINSRG